MEKLKFLDTLGSQITENYITDRFLKEIIEAIENEFDKLEEDYYRFMRESFDKCRVISSRSNNAKYEFILYPFLWEIAEELELKVELDDKDRICEWMHGEVYRKEKYFYWVSRAIHAFVLDKSGIYGTVMTSKGMAYRKYMPEKMNFLTVTDRTVYARELIARGEYYVNSSSASNNFDDLVTLLSNRVFHYGSRWLYADEVIEFELDMYVEGKDVKYRCTYAE